MSDNPTKKIYISYAHAGKGKHVTESLDKAFQANGVIIERDIKAVKYRESFKKYMEKLGAGDYVIAVIDKSYLESHHCMFELLEVHKNKQFRKRIFPVILPCAKIGTARQRLKYIEYWENEKKDLGEEMSGVDQANLQGIREELDLYVEIRSKFGTIADILADMNARSLVSHQAEAYKTIFDAIQNDINKKKEQAPEIEKISFGSNKTNSIEKIYLCNRKDQFTTFTKTARKKINALYIHGDELHGHDEMFSRFCNHLTGVYTADVSHRSNIKTSDIGFSAITPFNFKTVLSRSFLREFGIKLSQNEISKKEFRAVCKSNEIASLKTDGIVAIHFRIPGGEWFPELINQIEWFVDLCRTTDLPDNAPTFHFFFSVVYSRTNLFKQPILFGKLRRHKKNIIKALEDTSIPSINELSWVKDDHIRHWLSIIGVNDHEKRQRLMTKFFHTKHSRKGFYMSKLKKALTAVINDPQTTEL